MLSITACGYMQADPLNGSVGLTGFTQRRERVVMKPKVKVWIAFNGDLKFGEGRARLLELIEKHGSLQQAAKEFEMSYRNAWGYLGQLERAAGFKFVQRVRGGGPHGGMRLTPEAKRFLARYRRFRDRLDRAMKSHFERAFRR